MKVVKSEQAKLAVEIGRKNRKTFRPLEGRGLLTEAVYNDGWWYEPADQYKGVIPQEALARVELIQRSIPIKGLIVAHEAPPLLPTPKVDRDVKRQKAEVEAGLIAIIGVVIGAIAAVVGMIVAFPILIVTAILIDPALIVVCEDGTWVEICAWDDGFG